MPSVTSLHLDLVSIQIILQYEIKMQTVGGSNETQWLQSCRLKSET